MSQAGQPEPAAQEAGSPDRPLYEPGPTPGLGAATSVPLPPQPPRVPGASLAVDFPPAPHHTGPDLPPQYGPGGQAAASGGEQHNPSSVFAAAAAVPRPASGMPAEPVPVAHVPVPAEPAASGTAAVSATASVPMANRVMPPADPTALATSVPRPRVYGRPVQPEPEAEPVADAGRPEQQGQPFGGFPGGSPAPVDATQAAGWANPPQEQHFGGAVYGRPATPPPPPETDSPNWAAPDDGRPNWAAPDSGLPSWATPAAPAHNQPAAATPAPGQLDGAGAVGFGATDGAPNWTPPPPDSEQSRFDAFGSDAPPRTEPKTDEPPATPQVRNGRVLLAVILAALLILVVPLGTLYLLGMLGGETGNPLANVKVGECVKQNGDLATTANCSEPGAYEVTAKVEDRTQCGDPYVSLTDGGKEWFLCLREAGEQTAPTDPSGSPKATASGGTQ